MWYVYCLDDDNDDDDDDDDDDDETAQQTSSYSRLRLNDNRLELPRCVSV